MNNKTHVPMKKIILFIASITLVAFNAVAQDQDPKAKAILDYLSKVTKSYKTITSDYIFTIINKDKKQTEKQTGKVFVKGAKFKLEIPGNTIVSDGATMWAHNKDANEVTIPVGSCTVVKGNVFHAPATEEPLLVAVGEVSCI
jgi:outer membrane lipoprotein-sorting protein